MKKVYIKVSYIVVIVSLLGLLWYNYRPIKEINYGLVDYMIYNSEKDIEEYADLIVLAKMEKDFDSFKYTEEHPGSYYTITDVNVLKVFKGDYKPKNISLLQAAAILKSPRWGATFWNRVLFITGEFNTVMKKNSIYLLFLKKIDLGEVYCSVSLEQGKYNIDDTDEIEKRMVEKNQQYRELRKAILTKFEEKIKEH
jgi:hypothetical protein